MKHAFFKTLRILACAESDQGELQDIPISSKSKLVSRPEHGCKARLTT
jgi:hypothetical protein